MRKSGQVLAAALAFATTAADARAEDCFFSDVNSHPPSDCSDDPYRIAIEPRIQRAIVGLGFDHDEVAFRGCGVGRFSVSFRPANGRYLISYPLAVRYEFGAYAGPIAHELGHAAQIREWGSMDAARESLNRDSARIELGADFLAGLIFRRLMQYSGQHSFEESLDLLGSYEPGHLATHSQPEARTAAFRMGFFYEPQSATYVQAHRDFQRNRFGGIMEMLR